MVEEVEDLVWLLLWYKEYIRHASKISLKLKNTYFHTRCIFSKYLIWFFYIIFVWNFPYSTKTKIYFEKEFSEKKISSSVIYIMWIFSICHIENKLSNHSIQQNHFFVSNFRSSTRKIINLDTETDKNTNNHQFSYHFVCSSIFF